MKFTGFPQLTSCKSFVFSQFDTPIPVIQDEQDGHLYASLPALCAVFDLDVAQQVEQLSNHPLLKAGLGQTFLSEKHPVMMLRVGFMALWLTHLQLDDVPFIREREEIEQFQREAAQVLEEAFCSGRLTQIPSVNQLIEQNSPLATLYKEAISVLALIREQLLNTMFMQ